MILAMNVRDSLWRRSPFGAFWLMTYTYLQHRLQDIGHEYLANENIFEARLAGLLTSWTCPSMFSWRWVSLYDLGHDSFQRCDGVLYATQ